MADPIAFKGCSRPQNDFLSSGAYEAGYGGSAFCGKTYILLLDATRQIGHPLYYALIFRRIEDVLHDLSIEKNIDHIKLATKLRTIWVKEQEKQIIELVEERLEEEIEARIDDILNLKSEDDI